MHEWVGRPLEVHFRARSLEVAPAAHFADVLSRTTLVALMRADDSCLMMPDDAPPPGWLVVLRWVLLGLAVLVSAAAAVVFGFAVYLFAAGYSGGSNPESVAPLAIPLAFLVWVIVGVPAALVCALAWAGYFAAGRRIRRSSGHR